MTLEEQLKNIKDKAELHEWVDKLPEGSKGLFIMQMPDDPDATSSIFRHYSFGDITIAEEVYACKSFEHFMFRAYDA
jgi:hypothetical protein